jgi:hypothetical protein
MSRTPSKPSPVIPSEPGAPPRIYGFCWFKRDHYAEARALMSDPETLFDTFDEWLKGARQIEREMTERGEKVVRIGFDPVGFVLWCASHNRTPNADARSKWAAAEARRKFGGR